MEIGRACGLAAVALGAWSGAFAAESAPLARWLPADTSLYVEAPLAELARFPLAARLTPALFRRLVLARLDVRAFAWDEARQAAVCLVRSGAVPHGAIGREVDEGVLLATSEEYLESIIALRRDEALPRLSHDAVFQRAWSALPDDQPLRAFVRTARASRNAATAWRIGADVASRASDLPSPERIVLETMLTTLGASLARGQFLAVSLRPDAAPAEVTVVYPAAAKELGLALAMLASLAESRATYAPLLPRGAIVSLSTAIDPELAAEMARSLLDEERLSGLSQANRETKALLDGLLVGLLALDEIEPRLQLVVARQEYPPPQLRPDLPLPAVAVVFEPKNLQRLKPAFVLGFVNAIREANKASAERGRPKFVMHHQRIGENTVTAAVLHEREGLAAGRPEYNFSPAVGFAGPRLIVSTGEELAVGLVRAADGQPMPRLIDRTAQLDLGPVAGACLVLDEARSLLRQAATRRELAQRPLCLQGIGAIDRGARWLQDITRRVPQVTIPVPLPDLAGRYRLTVVAVE